MKINQTKYLIILVISFISILPTHSQCAGSDNSVTVCEKEKNSGYQFFDLFSQLNGSPTTGGIWESENPVNDSSLNKTTGKLNLWNINRFGEHRFIYKNAACGEEATVTVFLGGYPGEDNIDGGANACSSDIAVDLFTFLDNDSTDISSDRNGKWEVTSGTPTSALKKNLFNANLAGVGTHTLIYTVDAVNSCASRTATVKLEVHRGSSPGITTDIIICDTDDLSPYTNIDLFDYIIGNDSGGLWSDDNSTGQITSLSDSIINIQEIFDTFGSGDYSFTYTVFPSHGVCPEETATVIVSLPRIEARFFVNNQCKDSNTTIQIIHEGTETAIMNYDLVYEIVNVATNTVVHTGTEENIDFTILDDGVRVLNKPVFSIEPPLPPGYYTIRTSAINDIDGLICNTFTIAEYSFGIFDAKIDVENKCFDTNIIDINISELSDNDGSLSNNTHNIDYVITNDVNSDTIEGSSINVSFTNGEASIPVDFSSIPTSITEYSINITSLTAIGLNCVEKNFTLTRVPEEIALDLKVDNICNATDMDIIIDAPQLNSGQYTITYEVTELDKATTLIDNTIVFSGGNANFKIDISGLEKGNYSVVLKSVQNDTTPCRTKFEFELTEKFSINGIPDAPVLNENQTFCTASFFPNQPTLADISITEGENLTWYENLTSTTPLPSSTILVDGTTYFVSASDPDNSCESSARTLVNTKVISTAIVNSSNTTPTFCELDSVTLENFDAIANMGSIIWYDASTGGNILPSTTLIENGKSYFAVESVDGCEHHERLEFIATVISPPKPEYNGTTLLCALDQLTLSDIETDITSTTGFDLIWYDAPTGGNELSSGQLIVENNNYYVANIETTQGCESERTLIIFSLSDCDPSKYDFFIPDGFSPNNDSTNDNYYIPNIEFFYPNYELEIFNRYGQSLFIGNKENPKWNGENKTGGQATSGVYFYVLKYNKNDLKPKQGRIYLSK